MKLLFDEVKAAVKEGRAIDKSARDGEQEAIRQGYFATPLADMKKPVLSYSEATARASELIGKTDF